MIIQTTELDDYTYTIKIGKNAQENWDIISESSQNDMWFHLGGSMPSPHVVLIIPENFKLKKIPTKIITECGSLCKKHSKFANIKKVSVIYTEIKNVTKGETVGSVYTKKTTTVVL